MLRRIKQLNSVKTRAHGEKGFTLVELLVVIIIIGILASIAIPIFMNQQKTARDAATISDVKNVATNIQTGLVKFPNASYFALTDANAARTPVSGHNVDQDNDGKIMVRVGNSDTVGAYEEYMVTLSKGTKLKDMIQYIPISLSAIERRKMNLKKISEL